MIYSNVLSREEITGIRRYIAYFFNELLPNSPAKPAVLAQIRKNGDHELLQAYFDITMMFRRAVNASRSGKSDEHSAEMEKTAKEQGRKDSTPVQLLKLHMLEKLFTLDPLNCKSTGSDVTEGEFIDAVRMIGAFKREYMISRKHGERK